MANNAPFPIQPELTAITMAYRNADMIADAVLPRVSVGKQEFKYQLLTQAETFTVPDTRVGRKGKPNEVDFTQTEQTASTQDYGLDDPVPQEDIDNAAGVVGQDPLGRATEGITQLVLLDREVRVSTLVTTLATYPAANRTTLSGTSQWSDYANSNPVDAILTALDVPLMRPNVLVMGQAVWTKVSQHPKVVQGIYGPAATGGKVRIEQFAALLEVDELLIGKGWYNSAKRGQTATYGRIWGKHCAMLYRDKNADTSRGATFGLTAQWGTRVAGAIPDQMIGMRGGQRVRVGESVRELITASDLGYFFQNAVA